MNRTSMDVFALRDAVVGEYKSFATSFTTIYAGDIRERVEAIYAQNRYWPEPLIQINPSYKHTTTVAEQAAAGILDPLCADIFRMNAPGGVLPGPSLSLYKHQEQAIALAGQGASYVVTTGTGSGKSLCFFIPIVNTVLGEKRAGGGKRTRAIIIYPMNALANSQRDELDRFLGNVPGERPVTFARYTGQESHDERERIAANPPDILLTNFMMLELLMTRQDEVDRRVIGNCAGLRFLVLDELHTYRGRQGADVALLVRRVRERLSPERLQCIGTSATMASEGTREDKQRVVAGVASKLFAAEIPESNVIIETLERVTDSSQTAESVASALGPAIDRGLPSDITDAALRTHPLVIWVETRLGITRTDQNPAWHRASPRTVSEAGRMLSEESGRDTAACEHALRNLLLISSMPETERTDAADASSSSFFAFKLHQYISGAGHAYATLEPPGRRVVMVEGQQFLPGDAEKRLYALHFCRKCGHEYHPVRLVKDGGSTMVYARSIDDGEPPHPADEEASEPKGEEKDEREQFGFLTLHATDVDSVPYPFTFADRDDDYPESWTEYDAAGNPRLRVSYRGARPRSVVVAPTGKVGTGAKAWFLPGKFRMCLRCGDTQGGSAKDRTRLASLSAEGRSSATTVLVGSVLRWMHGEASGLEPNKRKLLAFTDNRQDAALQAGHFNDFLFVSLVRAGFLGALETAGEGGLRSEDLGSAQQAALGFDRKSEEIRAEWLHEPTLRGLNLQEAEEALRLVLAYRVWFDQRRGWRYTNPNLEQLGLVEVEYRGLDDLAVDEELFHTAPPILQHAPPAVRIKVYRKLLDHMRTWMAIRSNVLDPVGIEKMLAKSHARLLSPWAFGRDEKPRQARWLMIAAPSRRAIALRDEDLFVRGGSRSALGKALRGTEVWGGDSRARELKAKEVEQIITALLEAAATHGLVSKEVTSFDDQPGWKLVDTCIAFRKGTPKTEGKHPNENAFFRSFYANLAAMLRSPGHPLFGFEAREHTAQVDGAKRELREKRFRYGPKEQEELKADAARLRELGEAGRFLPVLFCSPTMELGVDISALNAVYLRNVPPTPANYAQRSGRAGRSGQAALVLTYCSAQGPHDQYFFRDPRAMVHGEVRPPLLDLANRDLVDSHLQAVWLACTEQPLDASIAELLVLPDLERPVKAELRAKMSEPRVEAEATRRMGRVLDLLEDHLTPSLAPWYPGRDEYAAIVATEAMGSFEKAFSRWRDLFSSAELQRDAARRTMDDYSAPPREKDAARSRHAQAMDQLNLLQRSESQSSDFYTYRYLATEGFLPGYNFPRLPLMAYIPATQDGRGRQTYLQRPRFLALSEFGPRSLVYHEGRAYRVVRALLALGHRDGASGNTDLPTKMVRICRACGAGHFEDISSSCQGCSASLGDAEVVKNVYRIENVATQQAERITANDEERQRQGFELQTTFEWAVRDGIRDVRGGSAFDEHGEIARLQYGPSATITRLNKGLRRRANRTQLGFRIDPVYGSWAKNDDEGEGTTDPTAKPRQWIVPSVQDRKNALLFQPSAGELSQTTLATVQHGLLRGIEARFQLEQGEVLAEPMPSRDVRSGFLLYEATEGGAGVLTRLVSEPSIIAEVALTALRIMHFDLPDGTALPSEATRLTDAPDTACVAACYKCLMSYFNQPDHELIDRRDDQARAILVRLAHATVTGLEAPAGAVRRSVRPSAAGVDDPVLARWMGRAGALGLPAPDAEPLAIGDTRLHLVWRSHYVVATIACVSDDIVAQLDERGFQLITFGEAEEGWDATFARLAKDLGR